MAAGDAEKRRLIKQANQMTRRAGKHGQVNRYRQTVELVRRGRKAENPKRKGGG